MLKLDILTKQFVVLSTKLNLYLPRSFREFNLTLLLGCLKETVKLCFALDHIHYSRWLSVCINDLEVFYVKNIGVFEMIWKNLGVRTSNADFSKVSFNQRQEMNNKAIKVRNGYINLVNKGTHNFWESEKFVLLRFICYLKT